MSDDVDRALLAAVIDDHAVVAGGIAGWCKAADPPIELAARYSTPATFLDDSAASPDTLDVVIFDLQFNQKPPDLGALTTLCERGFRVVIYSSAADGDLVLDCLEIGAAVYVSKEDTPEVLIAAVRAAGTDQAHLTTTMAAAMALDRRPRRPLLSARELEVLLTWLRTDSKALVARHLYITESTVGTHLERIREKYASVGRPAPTKAALTIRAIQDRLLDPNDPNLLDSIEDKIVSIDRSTSRPPRAQRPGHAAPLDEPAGSGTGDTRTDDGLSPRSR